MTLRDTLQPRSRKALALVALAIAGAAVGIGLMRASTSSSSKFDATAGFSVFQDTPSIQAPSDLTASHFVGVGDFGRTHESQRQLGPSRSRLLVFPSNQDRNVCYALLGQTPEDAAASYCFSPGDPSAPAGLAAEHFSALPLQSLIDGTSDVQVFGVALDDVVRMRLQADGVWRHVHLVHNSFYIDLPGVTTDQLGNLEVTLKGGTVQLHDMRTGLSVP